MAAREVTATLTGRSTRVSFSVNGQAVSLGDIAATREGWILSRCWLALEYFTRAGMLPADSAPSGLKRIAAMSVVLFANETGWGESEYNWNAGGIHCQPGFATPTPAGEAVNPGVNESCIVFPRGSRERLRDYNDLGGFFADFVRVVQRVNAGFWSAAASGQVSSVDRLQRSGYAQAPNYITGQELVSIYRRIYNTVNDAWRRDLVRPEEQEVPRASGGGGGGTTSGGTVAVFGLGLGLLLLSEKG
jgi:hypothetical protein